MSAAARRVALALDVGGTKIAGALVAEDGTLLHRTRRPSPRAPMAGTAEAAVELADAARERGYEVAGLGAGFPEYVDPAGRLTAREVIDWDEQPHALLSRTLPGVPVAVDSDVRCGARGEARWGGGAEEGFLYVSLGTGLSSTLILPGGAPLSGARGEAIALGELGVPSSVDAEWPGNLERYASGRGIGERCAALTGAATPGAREVTERAAAGDEQAAWVLDSAGRALGTALVWTVRLLDPAAIVLGGGLGSAEGGRVRAALDAAYAKGLAATGRPAPPPLRTAATGPEAGLLGAASLVLP
ncbi:ROK family glucokinase [Streptomyces albiaxialis]|uniref:ROK family glucokinase n=1 Tax=Streptomyces albiaxialis TaxID=329523 RepID=A0ABP5GX57_9ACTN